MARGLVICTQTRLPTTATSFLCKLSILPQKCKRTTHLYRLHFGGIRGFRYSFPTRSLCSKCSVLQDQQVIDLGKYKESFAKRMALAGLKPQHRIALGVSGGPDSMALCVLTAAWKTEGIAEGVGRSDDGFIDGLLAIVVDHGLRRESSEEADVVHRRVSDMGIRCEVARCSWSNGRPKQGHVQEAAREMRYQIFQNVCLQKHIGVLLVAHHADDQAELFILRLSRNSGVLGLAGMAFTSQIFLSPTQLCTKGYEDEGILLVRPLLHFFKEDMYKICQGGGLKWVEDPTNQSSLYARNRIRMSLANLSSFTFQSELQAVISVCQKTRAYVEGICNNLVNKAVTIMDHGYAIVDLEILIPSEIEDICLSKFVALILQFISQRHRPVRGSASKWLLDYIRTFPLKTSFTAAGCYLCPAPGSRGTKVLVCCSVDYPLPSITRLTYMDSQGEEKQCIRSELEKIIADGKSCSDLFVPDASYVHFLNATSESILNEAKRLNLIGESTYNRILLLKREETQHFKSKPEHEFVHDSKNNVQPVGVSPSEQLPPGIVCYYMNRFLVTWELNRHVPTSECFDKEWGGNLHLDSCSCRIDQDTVLQVRHMIESDWLYLAKLTKCPSSDNLQQKRIYYISSTNEQIPDKRTLSVDYTRSSAQEALRLLKSIPNAARRSLPVLVNHQGLLLSIPSIGFKHCPCIVVSCKFKPKVPLGGGHSSFI